jgi:hypothetical protein
VLQSGPIALRQTDSTGGLIIALRVLIIALSVLIIALRVLIIALSVLIIALRVLIIALSAGSVGVLLAYRRNACVLQ